MDWFMQSLPGRLTNSTVIPLPPSCPHWALETTTDGWIPPDAAGRLLAPYGVALAGHNCSSYSRYLLRYDSTSNHLRGTLDGRDCDVMPASGEVTEDTRIVCPPVAEDEDEEAGRHDHQPFIGPFC